MSAADHYNKVGMNSGVVNTNDVIGTGGAKNFIIFVSVNSGNVTGAQIILQCGPTASGPWSATTYTTGVLAGNLCAPLEVTNFLASHLNVKVTTKSTVASTVDIIMQTKS